MSHLYKSTPYIYFWFYISSIPLYMQLTNYSKTFRNTCRNIRCHVTLSPLINQKIAIYEILQVIIQYTLFYIVLLEVYKNKNLTEFLLFHNTIKTNNLLHYIGCYILIFYKANVRNFPTYKLIIFCMSIYQLPL
jgi:hypothetical protein